MMSTYTRSNSFTITHARQVTSKIKTDLKLLQRAYGAPSDDRIESFGEEAAQLLNGGYLGTVTYGFRKNGNWIVALRYNGHTNGLLTSDDRAGGIPRGVDVCGASFFSYLTKSSTWWNLATGDRQRIEDALPVSRTAGTEPGVLGGHWSSDRSYAANGSGVSRGTFKAL